MLKSLEMTGANIEEATQNALRALQLDRDSVQVEVLAKEKKGFLGIGSSPAKVKVTYEVPDEPAAPAAPIAKEAPVEPKTSAEPVAPETPAAPAEPIAEEAPKAQPIADRKPESPAAAAEKTGTSHAERFASSFEEAPAKAKSFIDELLVKMGIAGEAFVEVDPETAHVQVDIRGEDMGAVIGRRGDTLDAIQYLTSLYVNKGVEGHIRVTVNTENYRARREESLQRLARKMAGKAVRYHRNMTLEPMNPYERRIIHSALQDYSGVTTYSTGSEPNRRIVIAVESGSSHRGSRRSRGGYSKGNFDMADSEEN